MHSFRILLALLLVLLIAPTAKAQYVFLDANGDGVNDGSDHLNATGPTDLDIWFITNQNRDGSPATCTTNPSEPLTILSYEIVLRATHGTLRFGPMRNRLPFTGTPVCFAGYVDTTGATVYHNGWGYRDMFPPGRYLVATLTVEILSGSPSLSFANDAGPEQPTDLTSFGTLCEESDFDNTHELGKDFFDAGGIGVPTAEAGGPYAGVVGRDIQFSGEGSSDPDGAPLDYAWTFDDGGSAAGALALHAFSTAGSHTARLVVSNASGSDEDMADVAVATPNVPVAKAGGPYRGRSGAPVGFSGSLSFDPDGDPLTYAWEFGDGAFGGGELPHHIYDADGTYTVRLTVRDADHASTDETTATIVTPVNNVPIADAGGPYVGIADRWIQFNATASRDPDGDFLSFIWDFGDNLRGIGIVSAHAYRQAGSYVVTLTASDGIASGYAQSTATIAPSLPAEAFLEGHGTIVNVDDPDELVIVRVQPVDGAFLPDDVDLDGALLRVEKLDGSTAEVPPVHAILLQDDSDHDGVPEFVAAFPRASFRDLVAADAIRGRTHLQFVGGLYRGGSYVGAFDATFVRANQFDLTVTPNPFNPVTHIIIHTKSSGAVTAKLFDVHGRMVKTILRGEPTTAGRHDLAFEARDDAGMRLASGLYFLQVVTADGTKTGRVVVAK